MRHKRKLELIRARNICHQRAGQPQRRGDALPARGGQAAGGRRSAAGLLNQTGVFSPGGVEATDGSQPLPAAFPAGEIPPSSLTGMDAHNVLTNATKSIDPTKEQTTLLEACLEKTNQTCFTEIQQRAHWTFGS